MIRIIDRSEFAAHPQYSPLITLRRHNAPNHMEV